MSHKDAPPETPEQIRMREFYQSRGVQCGWGFTKDGRYHAPFANDAWAAWQEARRTTDSASGVQEFPDSLRGKWKHLTEESVKDIRSSDLSDEALAVKHGIHPDTVRDIKEGNTGRYR